MNNRQLSPILIDFIGVYMQDRAEGYRWGIFGRFTKWAGLLPSVSNFHFTFRATTTSIVFNITNIVVNNTFLFIQTTLVITNIHTLTLQIVLTLRIKALIGA